MHPPLLLEQRIQSKFHELSLESTGERVAFSSSIETSQILVGMDHMLVHHESCKDQGMSSTSKELSQEELKKLNVSSLRCLSIYNHIKNSHLAVRFQKTICMNTEAQKAPIK